MRPRKRAPLLLLVRPDTPDLPDVLARAHDEAGLRHVPLEVVLSEGLDLVISDEDLGLVLVPRSSLVDGEGLVGAACTVLAIDPRAAAGSRVVVALLRDDDADTEVLRYAVAEARRRGDELRLLLASGPGPRCTRRAQEAIYRREVELGDVTDLRYSASCAATDVGALLAQQAPRGSVLVLDRRWPLVDLPPGDLLLVRGAPERQEPLPEPYRAALARELELSPVRRDGSRTPDQLDDAWRTNVADPPVRDDVVSAWRRTQRPPSTWPPRRAAAVR